MAVMGEPEGDRMRCALGIRLIAMVLLPLGSWGAEAGLVEARDLVAQWVQTRQLVSRTRADGEAMKDLLSQTKAIHERELKTLEEALSRTSTNSTQVTAERVKAEGALAEANGALDRAKGVVEGLEAMVRELLPMLPPPLLEQAKPVIDRIPASPDVVAARGGVTERLQAVVLLLSEVDKFHQTVTVAGGRQPDGSGREVSVDTLYLGLGAAFYSDATGEVAGVGKPGKAGWEWQPKPEVGGEVRAALAMYRNSKPAAFVGLPLTIAP